MTNANTSGEKSKTKQDFKEVMIVNDDPGVETRIAILEDGRLEELYTERAKAATGVGNIYKGKVTNIESSIQAAFVEYGGPQSGFLHVTDLHPKYFPGKGASERVGKKIAKHNRPPIQKCLKRGDEVLIQVLKEGIGTKGPTLTSYLSIPGRLAVMMPYMDRVGISRKIEDLDERIEMKKMLDTLNLPEGFGFILRTAGMGKNKTEVKRDIAYLIRLWKMIEERMDNVGVPCPLYSESDLLVRTIRDIFRTSIGAVIVDSDSAYDRISDFLKIAAPRAAKKVIRYTDHSPIFHAFDIERQIEEVHSREVLLPSGGRLVIDQTEALVAIDVNSGKSRSARNSETNALNTNLEAADEICRQLRLRDLGGLVVNDLIDMGKIANRKNVEQRFQENLERDRARSTVLPLSRFGLMEMTRQRIRPSVLDSHYVNCTHCDGRGHVKTSEEVAADSTRHCGWLTQYTQVKRVELTCSPAVGTYLLSNKRAELTRHERASGKRIIVRISEEIATDKVVFYAYDERGVDIDLATLPRPASPSIKELLKAEKEYLLKPKDESGPTGGRGRSRRRGRKKPPLADANVISFDDDLEEEIAALDSSPKSERKTAARTRRKSADTSPESPKKVTQVYHLAKQLRLKSKEIVEACKQLKLDIRNHMSSMTVEDVAAVKSLLQNDATPRTSQRRRRRRGSRRNASTPSSSKVATIAKEKKKPASKKKRSRKSRRPKKSSQITKAATKSVVKKKTRRTLYGGRRRSVTSEEVQASMGDRG